MIGMPAADPPYTVVSANAAPPALSPMVAHASAMVRVTIKNNLLSCPLLTADNNVRKSCLMAFELLPDDANDEPATSCGRKARFAPLVIARSNSPRSSASACNECLSNSCDTTNCPKAFFVSTSADDRASTVTGLTVLSANGPLAVNAVVTTVTFVLGGTCNILGHRASKAENGATEFRNAFFMLSKFASGDPHPEIDPSAVAAFCCKYSS